jgi:hypothetical protein
MPANTRRYFDELSPTILPGNRGTSPSDPEFEARVRAKIGKRFEKEIPEKLGLLSLVGDPREYYPLYGVNFQPNLNLITKNEAEKRMQKELSESMYRFNENEYIPIQEGKRIFGLGSGASPTTWSHEIRHEKVKDELDNRLYDLMYSTSPQNYAANVVSVYKYLAGATELVNDPYSNKTFAQMEKEVLKRIDPILDISTPNVSSEYVMNQPTWDDKTSGEEIGELYRNKVNKGREASINWDRHLKINADPTRQSRRLLERKVNDEKTQDQINQLLNERATLPFLNFVGSPDLEDIVSDRAILPYGRSIVKEKSPKKKSTGGNVEKVYIERKMI